MHKIKTVFILGVNGFPYGTARIEKLKLIGKSLVARDIHVVFIGNEWGYLNKGDISVRGNYEGIDYLYTSGITHRPRSFFGRRWIKFKGIVNEMIYLQRNKCDAAIVSVISGMFFPLFFYWLYSRINGFKLYYPHHEEPEVTLNTKNLYNRLNVFLFNRFAWKMLDGAFPISDYLQDKIRKSNPGLPLLKIPAMVDFDIFGKVSQWNGSNGDNYFMYCGSIVYYEVIEFVIGAFEKVTSKEFQLHLVISGSRRKKEILYKRIEQSPKKHLISVYENLDYEILVQKYIHADALVIPLRDTIQDKARLPHKIGEYSASGNVIITNRVGDIPSYFEHKKNALLAESYNEEEYSRLMEYVTLNPEEVKKIGLSGYETGMKFFNYRNYGQQIINFMETT